MKIGIVGHEAAKFTPAGRRKAKGIILSLLAVSEADIVVSGGCHLGGVDVWAERCGDYLGMQKIIHPPRNQAWSTGYKPRNLLIARDSDIVHVIVVNEYPPDYSSMRFDLCYHCARARPDHAKDHIKSGGCWTAIEAGKLGKKMKWHVVDQKADAVNATYNRVRDRNLERLRQDMRDVSP